MIIKQEQAMKNLSLDVKEYREVVEMHESEIKLLND